MVAAEQIPHVQIPRDLVLEHVVERRPVERLEPAWWIPIGCGVPNAVETVGVGIRQRLEQVRVGRLRRPSR